MTSDPRAAAVASIVAAALVGALDYATGASVALSFFYVLPVIVMTRATGRQVGIPFAVACAGLFPIADALAGAQLGGWTATWNFVVRAATLVTIALLVDRLERALDHERALSRSDALTGVYNARWFREVARRELQRAGRQRAAITLAFMDLDNFKQVNDDLGHASGDSLLELVGRILKRRTRAIDVVGRLGGDEFAVVMPDTSLDDARIVIDRVRAELETQLAAEGYPSTVSFSIGMVASRAPDDDLDAFVLIADQLMYAAKRSGKNRVHAKDLTPIGALGAEGRQKLEEPLGGTHLNEMLDASSGER